MFGLNRKLDRFFPHFIAKYSFYMFASYLVWATSPAANWLAHNTSDIPFLGGPAEIMNVDRLYVSTLLLMFLFVFYGLNSFLSKLIRAIIRSLLWFVYIFQISFILMAFFSPLMMVAVFVDLYDEDYFGEGYFAVFASVIESLFIVLYEYYGFIFLAINIIFYLKVRDAIDVSANIDEQR